MNSTTLEQQAAKELPITNRKIGLIPVVALFLCMATIFSGCGRTSGTVPQTPGNDRQGLRRGSTTGVLAYVTSQDSNIRVIDTSNNTVVATLYVGGFPHEVAAAPDGTRVYVIDSDANGISSLLAIDTATNTVAGTTVVGVTCSNLVISPDGKRAYVMIEDPAAAIPTSDFAVIDTTTNSVLSTLGIGPYGSGSLAISPDGSRAYATTGWAQFPNNNSSMSVVDISTNSVLTTVPIGLGLPRALAIGPDGNRVYVAGDVYTPSGAVNDALSVIDTSGNTVVTTVPLAVDNAVAVAPDGKHVYVSGVGGSPANLLMSVMDTQTNTVVAQIPYNGLALGGVAFTPDGSRVYTTCFMTKMVVVIDTATNAVAGTIPVPDPVEIAIAKVSGP